MAAEMGALDSGDHGDHAAPTTSSSSTSSWSRVNGWSWPPHPFQLIAWAVVVYVALFFYLAAIPALVLAAQIACYVVSLPLTSETPNVFSGITYLMKHLICTICSSHKNDHRTSSIDCDLHKLMNTILCELKNLKDLLPLSPLIIINNILSGVLAIIAFYLTFYVAFFYYIVLYGIG